MPALGVVVCMYDYTQLSGRIVVHGAYETHPLTVCGNVLRENPHYLPIDALYQQIWDSLHWTQFTARGLSPQL